MTQSEYLAQQAALQADVADKAKVRDQLKTECGLAASPGERSDVEAQVAEATAKLENSEAALSAFESEHAELAAGAAEERQSAWTEKWADAAYSAADAFRSAAGAVAMTALAHQPLDLPQFDTVSVYPLTQEQQAPEQAPVGENELPSPGPEEIRESIEAQVSESRKASANYDDAIENAPYRQPGAEPKEPEPGELTNRFNSYTAAGVAEHGDFDRAAHSASERLYAETSGSPYRGQPEDLTKELAEKIEAKHGREGRLEYEALTEPQKAQEENRQGLNY